MKKTLLVLSAIATLFAFVSCGSKGDDTVDGSDNPTNTTPSGEQTPAAPAFVMEWAADKQYAAPEFVVQDDWKSVEIVFAEDTLFDKIQFAFTSDAVKAQQSWGTEYWAYYPKATATSTFVIADTLTAEAEGGSLTSNGATKIVKFAIQNVTKDELTVKVMSAKITKTDGTVIDVKPVGDWGSSVK